MFTWLGSKLTAILSSYVLGVVSALMTTIAPIALTAVTLWVLLYGWAVLRNEVPETVPSFLWKATKIGLVLAFARGRGIDPARSVVVGTGPAHRTLANALGARYVAAG